MAIDAMKEQIITLAESAKLVPARRAGKRTHKSCVYRWTTIGCRGVVLESIQVGATRCTSKEALARFFDALTVKRRHRSGHPAKATPKIQRGESAARRGRRSPQTGKQAPQQRPET